MPSEFAEMTVVPTVRLAIPEDADRLAPRLRQADLQEIRAATGESPLLMLQQGIALSRPCYTIVKPAEQPLALFGVIPDPRDHGVGRIWLLAADELVDHAMIFLRHCREWVDTLQQPYHTLWNYVDARNEVHIRWLKWCGFTFLRRIEQFGVEQKPFYEFERVGKQRSQAEPGQNQGQPLVSEKAVS